PSMIMTALAETGTAAHTSVMIGDTTYDMSMARSAGMPALGVGWGYHHPSALMNAGAYRVLTDYAEMPAALETLLAGEGDKS
ncbi:HAD hydrolase-like protein, partial [Acinetobacter baumannii]